MLFFHYFLTGRAIRAFESNCTCIENGLSIVATCTAVEDGITIWEGSAFHCPGDSIVLLHSKFNTSERSQGTCNDGAILARAIGVDSGDYISELNVTVTNSTFNSFYNKTLMCVHHNTDESTIGSVTLKSTNGTKL